MTIFLLCVAFALIAKLCILSSRMNRRINALEGADVRSKSTVVTVESVPVRPLESVKQCA